MVICTRRGCGVDYDVSSSTVSSHPCKHHPGAPIFHEGLKSWSCCKDTNKPVLEFDQFIAISGCQTLTGHTNQKQSVPTVKGGVVVDETPSSIQATTVDKDGKETFGNTTQPLNGNSLLAAQNAAAAVSLKNGAKVIENKTKQEQKQQQEEEKDPKDANQIVKGTVCKRKGCGYKSVENDRDRSKETCKYHKGSPIFHEGSKGWSCCKRRVLDFNDFLEIQPCIISESGHLFIGSISSHTSNDGDDQNQEQQIDCRLDHYETPNDVRLTIYAKSVQLDHSVIEFKQDSIHISLLLPLTSGSSLPRRFKKIINPFSTIVPSESSFKISPFKVDLILAKKSKGQSWPCLESSENVFGYGLTFGRDKDKK